MISHWSRKLVQGMSSRGKMYNKENLVLRESPPSQQCVASVRGRIKPEKSPCSIKAMSVLRPSNRDLSTEVCSPPKTYDSGKQDAINSAAQKDVEDSDERDIAKTYYNPDAKTFTPAHIHHTYSTDINTGITHHEPRQSTSKPSVDNNPSLVTPDKPRNKQRSQWEPRGQKKWYSRNKADWQQQEGYGWGQGNGHAWKSGAAACHCHVPQPHSVPVYPKHYGPPVSSIYQASYYGPDFGALPYHPIYPAFDPNNPLYAQPCSNASHNTPFPPDHQPHIRAFSTAPNPGYYEPTDYYRCCLPKYPGFSYNQGQFMPENGYYGWDQEAVTPYSYPYFCPVPVHSYPQVYFKITRKYLYICLQNIIYLFAVFQLLDLQHCALDLALLIVIRIECTCAFPSILESWHGKLSILTC